MTFDFLARLCLITRASIKPEAEEGRNGPSTNEVLLVRLKGLVLVCSENLSCKG